MTMTMTMSMLFIYFTHMWTETGKQTKCMRYIIWQKTININLKWNNIHILAHVGAVVVVVVVVVDFNDDDVDDVSVIASCLLLLPL